MKQVKEDFLKLVIAKIEDTDLFPYQEIANILVVLEQKLDEYEDFLKDIEKNKDNICIWLDKPSDENYYNTTRIKIHIEFIGQLYSYEIIIKEDFRMIGYCFCNSGHKGYDERYKCCGVNCDWYKPTFSIKKTEYIAYEIDFDGLQRDLWRKEDEFIEKYFGTDGLRTKELELERKNKEQELEYHKNMIIQLEEELKKL
jgi:hypothetical protein